MDWQSYYDDWKSFSREPGESESSTLERFAQTFGLDAPSKQALKDANPDQPVVQAVQEEPGFGTQLEAGLYETQKGFGEAIEGTASGFLDDMGLTGLSDYAEQYGRELSADARQELQRFPDPQTRQELEESGTLMGAFYRDFVPEGIMSPEELGRSVAPSLAPAGVALGSGLIAALAAPKFIPAALTYGGIKATTIFTGATSAAVGNLTGSFMVSGEEYESGKENPEIRNALGIDANVPFKDLSPQEQQAVAESAQNVAKDTMVERLYTSGALESLAFIPYGPLAIRYLADVALGATSEELDRRLGASNVVDELVRLGVDREEIPELKERVLALRPSMRDTLLNAALMEGIAGAPVAITESVASRVLDPRVDKTASDSKLMAEMKQKARLESEKQGLIEMRDRNRAEKEARQEEERQRANELKERQAAEKSALNILKIEDQKIRNQKSALELKNAEGQTTGFQDQILPTQKRSLRDRVKDVQPKTDRPTEPETALQKLQRQAQAGGEAKLAEETRQQFEATTEERVTAQEFEKSEQREAESFEDQTAQSLQEDRYLREVAAEDKAFADSARREEEANLKQRQDMGLLSYSKRGDYVDGETPLMSAGQAKSVLKTIQSYFPKAKFKIAAKSLKGNLLDPESKEILATGEEVNSEGFVLNEMGDQTPVYLVPENLTKEYLGDDVNSAVDRMVEVAFHEYLGHYGLRRMFNAGKFNPEKGEFSGSRYNKFIKKFELKNRRKINAWTRNTAREYADASQFVKAEEYIARNFAEKGVPELGFLRSLAVDIKNAIPGGQFRLNEDQVIRVLQDVQKQYAGSDRSIVAGTSATAEVGKDQEEAPKISASKRPTDFDRFVSFGGKAPLRQYDKKKFDPSRAPKKTAEDAERYVDATILEAMKSKVWPERLVKDLMDFDKFPKVFRDSFRKSLKSGLRKREQELANAVLAKGREAYLQKKKGNVTPSVTAPKGFESGGAKWKELVDDVPRFARTTPEIQRAMRKSNISSSLRPVDADPERFRLDPRVQKINEDLASGKIDKATQTVRVNKVLGQPKPFNAVPEPSTVDQIKDALGKKWERKFIIGDKGQNIEQGRRTSARLDINAYKFKNTWVPTIHDPENNNQVIAYGPTAHLKNVKFHGRGSLESYVGKALRVGLTGAKNPFAMYDGDWQQHDVNALTERAKSLMNDKEWTQVGMNPYRHSFFYDRSGGQRNGRPVVGADEVIQIGGMLLAKNVKYGNTGDFKTKFKGKNISFSKRLKKASDEMASNPDFQNWFKKSKIVNDDGTPKVVYHGTMSENDFKTFTDEEAGMYRGGLLAFFSEDPTFADIYAGGDPIKGDVRPELGRILPAFIRSEKPFDYLDARAVKKVVKSYLKEGQVSKNQADKIEYLDNEGVIRLGPKYANKAITPSVVNEEILTEAVSSGAWEVIEDASFVEHVRDMGYDSVYVSEEGSRNLAVFEPQQIKSVFNRKPTDSPLISQSIRPGKVVSEGAFNPITARILSRSLRPEVLAEIKDGKYIRIASDRFATGTYKPIDPNNPYLKDFYMRGGVGYTMIPENREAGAMWASDDEGIQQDIINKIINGVRYGLTYLMNPDSHLSNRAFWKIYEGETQYALDKGEIDADRLNARIQEILDSTAKKWADKKDAPGLKTMISKAKGATNWDKVKSVIPDSTFEQRKDLVKWLGGDPFKSGKSKRAAELAQGAFDEGKRTTVYGADTKELYKRTTQNEAVRNAPYGAVMSIAEFFPDFKGKMLSKEFGKNLTAKDFGVTEHEAYKYILPGKDIAVFEEPIAMDEAFDEWLVVRKQIARRAIKQYADRYDLNKNDVKDVSKAMEKIEKSPLHSNTDIADKEAKIFRGHFNAIKAEKASEMARALYLGGQAFTPRTEVLNKATQVPPVDDPGYLSNPTVQNFISASLRRSARTSTLPPRPTGVLGGLRSLVGRMEPLTDIKNRELFLTLRRLAKGEIFRAEEVGKKVYDALKASTDTANLYKYFTTKGQSPSIIKNPKERQMAIDAKKMIEDVGKALVKAKLLKQSTLDAMEGEYLPRVYLKHLLNEGDNRRLAQGMKADLSYLKQRKDIPPAVRDLILGEIKTQEGAPAYLASRAIMQPARDIALLNFLGKIATESMTKKLDWVLPQSLVEFNTLDELKKIAKSQKDLNQFLKDLDLDDDFSGVGKMVTPHFLEGEADRIQKQIFPILKDEKLKLANKLVTRMREVADSGVDLADQEKVSISAEYKQIPKQPRYGALGGMYVKKSIYDDVVGGFNMIRTGDESWAERVLGDTGAMGTFSRYWKWAKVSANPPSHVRNFISNLILMNLGGMPFYKMPGLFYRAIQDMRGDTGSYAIAKDMGLTATTFSNVELGRIEREFKDLQVRMKKGGDQSPLKIYGMVRHVLGTGMDKVGDMYGFIDALGKTMMLKHEMENNGLTQEEAAGQADKWLFDYSLVRPSVKYARNTSLAPFLTFQTKVLPLLLETALTKPWKFAPYYALSWGLAKMFKENHDLEDEQYEALLENLPEYLREKAKVLMIPGTDIPIIPSNVVALPWLDERGKIQFHDLSYLFPWGMYSELASELSQGQIGDAIQTVGIMGGPAINIATAIQTNTDPFTRREIVNEFDTPTEKATSVVKYAYNLSAPPFAHLDFGAVKRALEGWMEVKTREGEVRFTPFQGALRLVGQNITPIDPVGARRKNIRFMQSRLAKLIAERNRTLRDMRKMEKSREDIEQEKRDYGEKIDKLRNEINEYKKNSQVPSKFRVAS